MSMSRARLKFKDTPVAVLERILASGEVQDDEGNLLALHSNVKAEDGQRIAACIERYGISRTLEVGCGYGVSSLYICDAISKHSNAHHVIIDPFQSTDWRGVGAMNLRQAGYSCWELIEQPSELALPTLLKNGLKVQFALIDGWHTFDQALIDFFYTDRLLEQGGIVAFDDVGLAPITRVVRYVLNYPNYRLIDFTEKRLPTSRKRAALGAILRRFASALPTHIQEEYFSASLLKPLEEIGLVDRCAFLQKSGRDTRNWDWYAHF
jgi:predicted O-methyltransferase YrrM